jgi:diguanylate cyclase (GGDEF)-like protein
MATNGQARIVDVSEVQLRLAMVRAGVWLTWVVCGVGLAYAFATWEEQPNRSLIAVLLGVGIAGGSLMAILPMGRIMRTRAAEPLFLVWSLLDILLVAAIVAADGGATSPFGFVFFLPMIFAALFYPLRLFVVVGASDVLSWVAVASPHSPDSIHVVVLAACLGSTAVLCAWQAQNHDRQRALLNDISRSDALTGSLNRRGFEERVESELARSARNGRPLSLMLLDLNGFKAVNDEQGHAAGDDLLCSVVDTLKAAVRTSDVVGRMGGDEFAVLSPGAGRQEAEQLASRVREQVGERISVCAGVACFPDDGSHAELLYHEADRRLYEMKHGPAGKLRPRARELSWAAALARAVNERMGLASDRPAVVSHAVRLAQRLGWRGDGLESVRLAALLHDVGKMPLPDRILRKAGPLDPQELEQVKQHAVSGAEMVSSVRGLPPIAHWVLHSHENFDGSGYPDGLRGEAIPLPSRILRVVDAFDAMTSSRPYRPAMSCEEALEQLRRNSGGYFDPACVDMFEALIEEQAPALQV